MTLDRRLYELELAIAQRRADALPGGYESVLDEGFVEFGSSGRVWTREEMLEALRPAAPTTAIDIEQFEAEEVRPGVFLVLYVTVGVRPSDGATVRSRRSSLWVRDGDLFRMRFHQGTPLHGSGT